MKSLNAFNTLIASGFAVFNYPNEDKIEQEWMKFRKGDRQIKFLQNGYLNGSGTCDEFIVDSVSAMETGLKAEKEAHRQVYSNLAYAIKGNGKVKKTKLAVKGGFFH